MKRSTKWVLTIACACIWCAFLGFLVVHRHARVDPPWYDGGTATVWNVGCGDRYQMGVRQPPPVLSWWALQDGGGAWEVYRKEVTVCPRTMEEARWLILDGGMP